MLTTDLDQKEVGATYVSDRQKNFRQNMVDGLKEYEKEYVGVEEQNERAAIEKIIKTLEASKNQAIGVAIENQDQVIQMPEQLYREQELTAEGVKLDINRLGSFGNVDELDQYIETGGGLLNQLYIPGEKPGVKNMVYWGVYTNRSGDRKMAFYARSFNAAGQSIKNASFEIVDIPEPNQAPVVIRLGRNPGDEPGVKAMKVFSGDLLVSRKHVEITIAHDVVTIKKLSENITYFASPDNGVGVSTNYDGQTPVILMNQGRPLIKITPQGVRNYIAVIDQKGVKHSMGDFAVDFGLQVVNGRLSANGTTIDWDGPTLEYLHIGLENGRMNLLENQSKESLLWSKDQAMSASKPEREGGINLNSDQLNLQIQNAGEGIKFNVDPAMLQQLRNAPGFTPVIMNIQPLESLPLFLGIKDAPPVVSSV